MKKCVMLLGLFAPFLFLKAQRTGHDKYPVYTGKDLGLVYSPKQSVFKIWSPAASEVEFILYDSGHGGTELDRQLMKKESNGVWSLILKTDTKGKFYAFRAKIDGAWQQEVADPYAKAVGVNGKRAAVINMAATNPDGWNTDKSPVFKNPTNAVIYELHVRDASIALNSGIQSRGLFTGLAEAGTKSPDGLSTGLDHLKELGVTHIHLLPFFDFNSIDETKPNSRYNWGYDPLNYNVPEGSYASDPYDPAVRIREFKQLVQAFHKNGLRVIMDVVYNHTGLTSNSNFNQLVPGYYYRQNKDGKFSDATACGNETASERPMMRKFIIESMKHWVEEYHIDGFRVDLMGVHDIVTMNLLSKELHRIKPGILIYGEGWTAGASPLPDSLRALKANAAKLDRIAVFSDDIRDGIKGSVFTHTDKGFASGKPGMEESIKFGVVASCRHPQVDYSKVNYSKRPYATAPSQVITYCECHDNHVLWDKLSISAADATEMQRKDMHKLALSIVLTSQGISFLHAGTEFLRTKHEVENSYNAPDSINAINWSLKKKNNDIFAYTKAMIALRKTHPAFRMPTAAMIAANIRFRESADQLVSYTIDGAAAGDSWKKIFVVLNGSAAERSVALPQGNWKTFSLNNTIGGGEVVATQVKQAAYSCSIFYQ